eukprot:gnl/MRDRNA2_/MRDRNA2_28452_c0_seq1.p1 gnl/MRDRNA2_/MRDRNA2_28452_c0~~gnl/MRDRNA2_/MRDRNA2_28452_c0_seq1.p1  ORF type:complete len:801 (+),score=135.73 gnl/MRDRNA2_/MRDRNA2_28452_c0_seq1:103-2505(+)
MELAVIEQQLQPVQRSVKTGTQRAGPSKQQINDSIRRAHMICYLGRLRHLHSACEHPLLQAVALSSWGSVASTDDISPQDLLERFACVHPLLSETVVHDSAMISSPLIRALQAVRTGTGQLPDLAIAFVAYCRANDVPARLVLAVPLTRGGRDPFCDEKSNVVLESNSAVDCCESSSAACASRKHGGGGGMVEMPDVLKEMGISNDAWVAALLQSEMEEADDPISHAVELLMEGEASSSMPSVGKECNLGCQSNECNSNCGKGSITNCPSCNEKIGKSHKFCGSCGALLPGRGGEVLQEQGEESVQELLDEELVQVWPEVYDASMEQWVAVDLKYHLIIPDPAHEWLHRGTPMLWVCSADDQLSNTPACLLRDVTARYSPNWWQVSQARGSGAFQEFWNSALSQLSSKELHPSTQACEADSKDVLNLRKRQMHGGSMPQTKAGLRHHPMYCTESVLRIHEGLRPEAKPQGYVDGEHVFLRTDVTQLRSAERWRLLGRVICEGQEPISRKGSKLKFFAEWQTRPSTELVLRKVSKSKLMPSRGSGRPRRSASVGRGRGRKRPLSSDGVELVLPALPAPKKSRKVSQLPAHFKKALSKLEEWLQKRGYLPWSQGNDSAERKLGRWVEVQRIAYHAGRLNPEQVSKLEAFEQWNWGPQTSNGTSHAQTGSSKHPPSASSSSAQPPAQPPDFTDSTGGSVERWQQLTLQRLAAALANLSDAAARRQQLRQWQRIYHPDKNPGRTEEVQRIFRWVQECWYREGFRVVSDATPYETQQHREAPTQPECTRSAPRRRMRGKRSTSHT